MLNNTKKSVIISNNILLRLLQNRVPRVQVLLPLPVIFGFGKRFPKPFSLLIIPKIIPPLCDVQIYGAVESVNRRFLCGLAAVDINSLGGVYAFVSEQNGDVLNRHAVVVKDTRH